MRLRAVVLASSLAASGCGHAHPAPAAGLVTDLQLGIVQTLRAMQAPALGDRQVADQALQLAYAIDPERMRALTDGRLPLATVLAESRQIPARLAGLHRGYQPPEILVWLIAHGSSLSAVQRELLEAVRCESLLELADTGTKR